jgi:hypothetical protein
MKLLFLGALLLGSLMACSDDGSGGSAGSSGTAGGGASAGGGGSSADGGGGAASGGGGNGEGGAAPMTLTSPAYDEGGMIPVANSCDGENVSPALEWTAGPSGTLSYAIIFRDLSNNLGHAAIWDIPASTLSLPADVDRDYQPADVPGAVQCDAYDGQPGYAGPCPPNAHTYEFRLYAVPSASLNLDELSIDVDGVESAANQVALASTTLSATYTP